jgi:hypothetical protein
VVWLGQFRYCVLEDQEICPFEITAICRTTDPTGIGSIAAPHAAGTARCGTRERRSEPHGRFSVAIVRRIPLNPRRRRFLHLSILTSPPSSLAARTMAVYPPHQRDFLTHLLNATRPNRLVHLHENQHWRHWAEFAVSIGQHPLLPNTQTPARHLERTLLFLAFAVALRQGRFHDGKCVRGAEVERALRECAQLMVAQGLEDPRKSDSADHRLACSITTYIASCKTDDPPALPQQAIPSSVIRWIANNMGRSQQQRTIVTAHLIVLAFFFLLRVGEYTPSREKRRTIPLRKKDIRLWRAGTILPNDSPLDVLISADSVTICLENQKNGHKNALLHHTSSNDTSVDLVKSAAILIHAIRNLPETTPIGSFIDDLARIQRITADEICSAIQIGAIQSNLAAHGYSMSRISSHSIRSGGAMHLKLAGYDNDIIQKLGRWSSTTYLHYIQTQIGQLTAGIAQQMASVALQFHIVA